jgi:glycosyltransferase involved in cell wall biosynthesis
MRIAIDCRMLGKSGIGVYLENILQTLVTLSPSCTFLLIGSKKKIALTVGNSNNCDILPCDISIFSKDEFLKFPVGEINQCDVYYTPNFNIPRGINIPVYSTIHDVVPLDIKITSCVGRIIRKYMLKRAIQLSKKIFTVSEFSKERILHHFGTSKEIIVTYNGITYRLKNHKVSPQSPYPFEYILYVGNIKKHKGLNILLESFDIALKKGFDKKLVIVGNMQNFMTKDGATIEFLKKPNDHLVFTGSLSDEVLYNTIAHAKCIVQPSLYEGFGIPPLEALYLRCPVILSDIPVFKEIYGDFPVRFFQPGNKETLVEQLMAIHDIDISIKQLRDKINFRFNYANSADIIYKTLIEQ